MSQTRLSSKLVTVVILTLFLGIALYLRIYPPYDQVFTSEGIRFTGIDAYYHMRLIDNLVYHFPHRLSFDLYTFYPHGFTVPWPPFFDWLLVSTIWLIGLGSPTQHTIDVVSVYFPAVLGALTVIPVYFIGKQLFNRWAGVISSGLVVLLPGEFLNRSILGFTDHHVAETLFTTITVLFLLLAIKSARQRQLNFNHLKQRDWATITKPLVYGLLAGLFLGIYLLTWVGGLLFIFLIFVYFIIQFIIDHLRRVNNDYLVIVGVLPLLTALVISFPVLYQAQYSRLYLASLPIAILTPLILAGISRLMAIRKIKPAYYPLALVGLGLAGLAIFYVVNPSLLESMLGKFGIFAPKAAGLTIIEKQPLLIHGGEFSFFIAWGNFTTSFFLIFIALGILIYLIIKEGSADKTFLVVWSLIMLAATLGQRRFAYYLTINAALLTGYLSWQILEFFGFKKLMTKSVEVPQRVKRKSRLKKGQRGFRITTTHITMALGVIIVFFLAFFPNISPAIVTASQARFAPDDAWSSSLSWLKDNTPDPFGDPDSYYELYEPPPPREDYNYPTSAYSIMSWWDYGHWITRISRRIPISNPFQQGAKVAARFFSAQDEVSANEIMDKLGSRYVIIDHAMSITKFYAMATFAGRSPEEFYDVYYQRLDGKLTPKRLYYPEYYRSLVSRLYNFDGKTVTPQESRVISYQPMMTKEGKVLRVITSAESFSSYEAAVAYVSSQKSDKYKIVSPSPFVSPVPLEALEHYKLIYSSEQLIMERTLGMVPEIKIFEYVE